ncbi:hypothetical protein KOR42_33640 [Thalassoglobus neptunius]|uniref:Uncharacterized protein n=1 Tax=Thalassoglobus neptunius TaxID=1938619 RepID=A0A5C5WMP5_9PLAN|nr:hypothetical protein KOR42_33640 [Thalassoglobus neptunius]
MTRIIERAPLIKRSGVLKIVIPSLARRDFRVSDSRESVQTKNEEKLALGEEWVR